jgi:hypothetical protein
VGDGEGSRVAMKTSEGDTVGCSIVGSARFNTFFEAWLMKENQYYDK